MLQQKGKQKVLVIAAGGTGGHVFPALCVANSLACDGFLVIFATDTRGSAYLNSFNGPKFVQSINNKSRIKLMISLSFNILSSAFFLLKNKVDCVIGFGGYPSIPAVLAAQCLRIKTIIHEQNAVIGKANKLLSIMAHRVITSFPCTISAANSSKKNIYIGNPTRFEPDYIKYVSKIKRTETFTILIFGGSQGAKIFSKDLVEAICEIAKINKVKIYHQIRKEDICRIRTTYSSHNVDALLGDFFENIGEFYMNSDLVISRSGASSIFEIIGFRKPSILIPFKSSINGDQEANARFLSTNEAAIVIDETQITKPLLIDAISQVIQHPELREKISKNLKKIGKANITNRVVQEIERTLAGAPGFEPGK